MTQWKEATIKITQTRVRKVKVLLESETGFDADIDAEIRWWAELMDHEQWEAQTTPGEMESDDNLPDGVLVHFVECVDAGHPSDAEVSFRNLQGARLAKRLTERGLEDRL